jgi:hypothetical protein
MLQLKAAFSQMKAARGKKFFFFYCEKGEDGKPVLLIDTKAVPPREQAAVLQTAKNKAKCHGTMFINKDAELNVLPKGSALATLERGIQTAARNQSALVFSGIVVGPVEAEEEGGGTAQSAQPGAPAAQSAQPGAPATDEARGSNPGLQAWEQARNRIVEKLKLYAKIVGRIEMPDQQKVQLQLLAVARQLTTRPTTLPQVNELERYLSQDAIVRLAEEFPGDSIPIRQPLLAALATIKQHLPS